MDHHTALIRFAYFCLFLAKGSLYPFLALLLRARGCNLFLIGIATNTSAITRLMAGPLVFAALNQGGGGSTTGAVDDDHARSRQHRNVDALIARLLSYVANCVALAVIAALLFVYAQGYPLVSACCVGFIMAALALTSLAMDSTVVRELCVRSEVGAQHEHGPSMASTASDVSSTAAAPAAAAGEDVVAAAGFGEMRMFGSLGWGIGAPLQVFLVSWVHDHFGKKPTDGELLTGDAAAWFSVVQNADLKTNGSGAVSSSPAASPPALISSIVIFVSALFAFTIALRSVFSANEKRSAASSGRQHRRAHRAAGGGAGVHVGGGVGIADDVDDLAEMGSATEQVSMMTVATASTITPPAAPSAEPRPSSAAAFLAAASRFSPALLLAILYGTCDGVVSTFLFPYLKEAPRSVSTVQLSWIPAINVLSELPVLFFSKRLHGLFTSIHAMHGFILVLWALRLAVYSLLERNAAQIIFFVELLNGLCFAGAFVLSVRHVVALCGGDADRVPLALSLLHGCFYGMSSVIVGAAGGLVAQLLSTCVLFMALAAVCALVAFKVSL
jgi:hypothetical protein